MFRWERRLKDGALALDACGKNYCEPELFRLNANHFLTTARTVSFLFQKDKTTISGFAEWHSLNVVIPWANDKMMKWAVEARNIIEKEGDLDLHSTVSASLMFSYIQEEDITLVLEKNECMGVTTKQLIRFARTKLPSAFSDVSAVRIERTWIANSLPEYEILQAFRYIYARLYEACTSLAVHLGSSIDKSIPVPASFDEVATGSRQIRYVKLTTVGLGRYVSERMERNTSLQVSAPFEKIQADFSQMPRSSLNDLLKLHSALAEASFNEFKEHMAMLWLYDKDFNCIDFISVMPEDQVSKFIFWRMVGDRIHYLRASYVVWVSEAWMRDATKLSSTTPVRNLPVTGEFLQVVGIDGSDNYASKTWAINRKQPGDVPVLAAGDGFGDVLEGASYLIPARRALAAVRRLRPK